MALISSVPITQSFDSFSRSSRQPPRSGVDRNLLVNRSAEQGVTLSSNASVEAVRPPIQSEQKPSAFINGQVVRVEAVSVANESAIRRESLVIRDSASANRRATQVYEDTQQLLRRDVIDGLVGIDVFA